MTAMIPIIVAIATLTTAKVIDTTYNPTEDQLKIIFPDEYETIKMQKEGKVKAVPKSCANKTCTLEEIYEIFGADPVEVTSRIKDAPDRTSIDGSLCPKNTVPVGVACVPVD